MPRSRLINPEFYDDVQVGRLSMAARVAFPGLWCWADRDGRLKDEPMRLRARIFPYDVGIDMEALLAEMVEQRLIQRYVVDGAAYIQIRSFTKHQKPHPRETPGVIPACQGEPKADPRQTLGEPRLPVSVSVSVSESVSKSVSEHRAPRLMAPAPKNAAYAGRVCVPDFLDDEFARKSSKTHDELQAWYRAIEAEWAGRPIGDTDLAFWRKRFGEWIGSTTAPVDPNTAAVAAAKLAIRSRMQ